MRFSLRTLFLVVACAAIVFAVVSWIASFPRRYRESFRKISAENLVQIGKALRAYHADHGSFPPAKSLNDAGPENDRSGRPHDGIASPALFRLWQGLAA